MHNCSRRTGEFRSQQAVSVTEMARLVELSRSRFHQLVGTVFPPPVYDPRTRRPFYTLDQQRVILDIRTSHRGFDGGLVLFNSPRAKSVQQKHKSKRESKVPFKAVVTGVRSLGLKTTNAKQVEAAVKKLFPDGIAGIELEEVLPRVFLDLQGRNSSKRVPS